MSSCSLIICRSKQWSYFGAEADGNGQLPLESRREFPAEALQAGGEMGVLDEDEEFEIFEEESSSESEEAEISD